MDHVANRWPDRKTSSSVARICAGLSRFLLLLAAVELITMPLTQQIWTWDHFLRGGQDFEFGLLTIVTCLCLGLLRAQHCRQRIKVLLAVRWLFCQLFRRRELLRTIREGVVPAFRHGRMADPGPHLLSLPLQI